MQALVPVLTSRLQISDLEGQQKTEAMKRLDNMPEVAEKGGRSPALNDTVELTSEHLRPSADKPARTVSNDDNSNNENNNRNVTGIAREHCEMHTSLDVACIGKDGKKNTTTELSTFTSGNESDVPSTTRIIQARL